MTRETPTETTAYQEAVEKIQREMCKYAHGISRPGLCDDHYEMAELALDAFLSDPGLALKVLEEAGAVQRGIRQHDQAPPNWVETFPRVSDPTEGP